MEALTLALIVIVVIAGLIAFDLLALRFGVDSRERIGDDHDRGYGIQSRTGRR